MNKNFTETPITCDICKNKNFSIRYKNVIADKSILKCKNCGTWVLYPFPSEKSQEKIYQNGYYTRWGYGQDNQETIKLIKKRLYLNVLKKIELYTKPTKILDIGCAMGFSLEVAKERGLQPYGVEVSVFAGKIARKKFRDNVKIGDIKDVDFKNDYFDAITMVDLLEHLMHPLTILRKARSILKEKGILAIVIPNTLSFSSKVMKHKWPHINEEHLYYYSPYSIMSVLSRIGFKIESVKAFPKPITLSYAKSVLKYGRHRAMYYLLNFICKIGPTKLTTIDFQLPTGEMLIMARKLHD
ncbi:MAG: class I SAM-dependent methyltransferase [Candidatus Omnitrophica bacterium]|nr:class I SAM-dependent methyltransferase [Candidatus Omnitrophota bacterium]